MTPDTIPLSFVLWLLGFLASLLGGCWGIFKYFDIRLNAHAAENEKTMARIYERMDMNKESYYKEFVTKSVYEAEARLKKETTDGRFERIVELFNQKIESLRHEIRGLIKNQN